MHIDALSKLHRCLYDTNIVCLYVLLKNFLVSVKLFVTDNIISDHIR